MPDAFELPRLLRPIVPLVGSERFAGFGRSVVNELIAFAYRETFGGDGGLSGGRTRLLPSFAAIVGTLNDLPEPAAGLRCIDTVRVNWRTFEMVNVPARKIRATYLPVFALAIRGQDKRAFVCSY